MSKPGPSAGPGDREAGPDAEGAVDPERPSGSAADAATGGDRGGPTGDGEGPAAGRGRRDGSAVEARHREQVCVLVPTYNEAATIGDVVEGFRERGYRNVLVVDGHSTDGTREVAREHGARVMVQSGEGRGSGKGQAVREGIAAVDAPYVLMLDGDGTYDPADADRMVAPLVFEDADHVIGDRFGDMREGAMPRLNQVGNRVINRAFRVIHRRDFGDILSGYRAMSCDSVRQFALSADGFTIETELTVECVKHNVETAVVPITYRPRPDGSDTSLDPFRDGGRIVFALYSLAKTNNPLFYFGSVGIAALLSGGGLAAWVGYEWFVPPRTPHEVLAVVSGFGVLLGVQLLIFGVLSDMVATLHREQLRRLRQIEARGRDRPAVGTGPTTDVDPAAGPDPADGAVGETGRATDAGGDGPASGPGGDAGADGDPGTGAGTDADGAGRADGGD